MDLIIEIWRFLKSRKKLWLAPIIFWLLVMGLFLMASGTVVAPFIYTVF